MDQSWGLYFVESEYREWNREYRIFDERLVRSSLRSDLADVGYKTKNALVAPLNLALGFLECQFYQTYHKNKESVDYLPAGYLTAFSRDVELPKPSASSSSAGQETTNVSQSLSKTLGSV